MKNKSLTVFDISKKFKNRLRIGTCTWNYPEWQKVGIYSARQKRHFDYLPEYAEHYNTAEVDQWFYSLYAPDKIKLPNEEDVDAYMRLTPDEFKFTIKAPNSITLTQFGFRSDPKFKGKPNPHFLSKDVLAAFLKTLKPLKEKIAVIMFEFEYMNKQKMESLDAFVEHLGPFLDKLPKDYSFGIETRNPNYLKPEYFKFLKSHNVGHVFSDVNHMPLASSQFEEFGKDALTSNPVVIRLLGEDRMGIEEKTGKNWSEIVQSRDDVLKKISEFINKSIAEKVDVYANFNNHLEGCAPLSISKFVGMMD